MVELSVGNYKTVAIKIFKHFKRRNENNEGLQILSIEKATIKNAASHISNWGLKEKRKKWDRTYLKRCNRKNSEKHSHQSKKCYEYQAEYTENHSMVHHNQIAEN